jgi:hypothetical protein
MYSPSASCAATTILDRLGFLCQFWMAAALAFLWSIHVDYRRYHWMQTSAAYRMLQMSIIDSDPSE